MNNSIILKLPALSLQQKQKHRLYAFAIDGKQLDDIAQISRLGRNETEKIIGYQRPEILSHISEIKAYLESEAAILPNAIVVAFDSRVKFLPLKEAKDSNASVHGYLSIPLIENSIKGKPGWIVDGQQRVAAIRDANLDSFPIFVTAFITDNVAEQREQFILVNSTKPLPKGLIYELLPSTKVRLSANLQRKRFPAYLLERLNFDSRSPLHQKIQTPTTPDGQIKDNSILRMLENSLNDGALYRFRADERHAVEIDKILCLLFNFWTAVSKVFPEAWKLPPNRSRLTHGAGIVTMGHLMDAIADRLRKQQMISVAQFESDLTPLKQHCSWTSGYWDFGNGGQRKWNEIQNTSKDIHLVANFLLVHYKRLVWSQSR